MMTYQIRLIVQYINGQGATLSLPGFTSPAFIRTQMALEVECRIKSVPTEFNLIWPMPNLAHSNCTVYVF